MMPPWLQPRTAYIHVPFCAHHCGYCDFAVIAGHDHLADLYIEALAAELATLGEPRPVETLFIGGGTPTHLNPDQLRRLLESLRRWLPLVSPSGGREPPELGKTQGAHAPRSGAVVIGRTDRRLARVQVATLGGF